MYKKWVRSCESNILMGGEIRTLENQELSLKVKIQVQTPADGQELEK